MNVKLKLGEVILLIDKKYPIDLISNQLQPIAKQAGLLFAEHQVGAGYIQWSLPGSDWIAFPAGTEEQKSAVAQIYKNRKNLMQDSLQGSILKETIFSLPSEDFIFFRPNGANWDIALTAWGYKYPNKVPSTELDTWIKKQNLQAVNVGFVWNEQTLPDFTFKLAGHTRVTSTDGLFHIDGSLPVGNSYPIETMAGHGFILVVEKGKFNYVFDLTEYFQTDITVYKDEEPMQNSSCILMFNGQKQEITTDETGHAHLQIAMVNDLFGQALNPQPACIVTCNNESQQQTPSKENNTLNFVFNIKTETPPSPPPHIIKESVKPEIKPSTSEPKQKPKPEPEYVYIQLKDYGGFPLVDIPFFLTTKKKKRVELKTDNEGCCKVPKEWFTPKEKIKIDFIVSSEYQQTHDLHDKKKQ